MRVAVFADIHGNLPAFEAALADLNAQAPDAVFLGGDQINRCPWNNEVMDLMLDLGWPAIQGNHELVVGAIKTPENWWPFTERHRFPILWWSQENLHPDYLPLIRTLPESLHIHFDGAPPIWLLHGLPGNPHMGFYPAMTDDDIRGELGGTDEQLIISSHTHRPLDRRVDGWRIVNPGSVGLPYNGDPRAQYALLDLVAGPNGPAWQATFRQVAYDHSVIPSAYHASGLYAAGGPKSELALCTLMSGHPWSSDFGVWMRHQPLDAADDMGKAVADYLAVHGPDHWAFDQPDSLKMD
ncbi:MAG: metallophosphoesterase family protein [Caldilineaceae bacterium]|nr:metallophosphoesterase family protein [Caldilineaceae bacterium]